MGSKGIKRLADNLIRYRGPVRTSDNLVLDQTFLTAQSGTISFNVYDEGKEHFVAQATTRLKDEVLLGATTWLIPVISPLWVEVGDDLEITDDNGFVSVHEVTVIVTGANEVTLTVIGGLASNAAAGSKIRLIAKGTAAIRLPLMPKAGARKLTTAPFANTLELVSTAGVILTVTPTAINTTRSTQDLKAAVDQEEFLVATIGALGGEVAPLGRVRAKIVDSVAMTEYGGQTPAVFADWTSTDPTKTGGGFEGTFIDSLAGIEAGQMLRIEINFNADPALGLKDIVSFLAPVIEG